MRTYASQYQARENQSICFVTTSVIRAYVSSSFSLCTTHNAAATTRAIFLSRISLVSAYRIVSLAHKARPRTPRMTNAAIWRRSLCVTFTIGVLKPAGVATYIARKNSVCLQKSLRASLVRFSPFPADSSAFDEIITLTLKYVCMRTAVCSKTCQYFTINVYLGNHQMCLFCYISYNIG